MIAGFTLKNFKAHRDTELGGLQPLTLLVGPNASGKTSVLQGMHYLSQLTKKPVHDLFRLARAPELLLRRGATGPMQLRANADSRTWASLVLNVQEPSGDDPTWDAKLSYSSSTPRAEGEHETRSATPDPRANFACFGSVPFLEELGASVLFRLDARRIAAPGNSDRAVPRVEHDGGNTAAALAALKLADDDRFDAIVAALRELVPSVRRLRLRPARMVVGGQEIGGHEIVFDFQHATGLPASAASEGTLLTLALLTALHSPARPRLVLLDDVEQALHPTAQMAFMRQLSALVATARDLQVVATTHSPYVLDGVGAEQVIVLQPRDDGSIATRPLSDHPAAGAPGRLSAGQVWSLDPERWILQGSP